MYVYLNAIYFAGKHLNDVKAGGLVNQSAVDEYMTTAERLRRINVPRPQTKFWLDVWLHYSHTISGHLPEADYSKNEIIAALSEKTGLNFNLTRIKNRDRPNARWLTSYCMAAMDSDSMTNLAYGEVYIPLTLAVKADGKGLYHYEKQWTFPAGMHDSVRDFTSEFCHCFWVDGGCAEGCTSESRHYKMTLQNGKQVERVEHHANDKVSEGYEYSVENWKSVRNARGSFLTTVKDKEAVLTWRIAFSAGDSNDILGFTLQAAQTMNGIDAALGKHFAVKTQG